MEVKRKMRQGEAAGISFWVWLHKKDNSAFPQRFHLFTTKPTLNMPFSFTRRMSCDPWALLLTKSLVSSRCCLCSVSFDGGTASSLKAHMDSTPPQTALVKWSFVTGRPMFLHWVVQPLSTSPDDPYSASGCKIKMMADFVSMYGDRESEELLRFKGCPKSYHMDLIAKMFKWISFKWVPPSIGSAPLSTIPRFLLLQPNFTPTLPHALVSLIYW